MGLWGSKWGMEGHGATPVLQPGWVRGGEKDPVSSSSHCPSMGHGWKSHSYRSQGSWAPPPWAAAPNPPPHPSQALCLQTEGDHSKVGLLKSFPSFNNPGILHQVTAGSGNLGSDPPKGWLSTPELPPQRGHPHRCRTAPAPEGSGRKDFPRTAGGSRAACSIPEPFPAHSQLDEGIRVSIGVHGRQVDAAHDAHDEPALLGAVHQRHQDLPPLLHVPAAIHLRHGDGKTQQRSGRGGMGVGECRVSAVGGMRGLFTKDGG